MFPFQVWEEPQFCSVYANLCKVLSPTKVEWTVDGDTLSTTFRRVVLTKSQQEFEKDRRENEEKMDRLLAIEDVESVRNELWCNIYEEHVSLLIRTGSLLYEKILSSEDYLCAMVL